MPGTNRKRGRAPRKKEPHEYVSNTFGKNRSRGLSPNAREGGARDGLCPNLYAHLAEAPAAGLSAQFDKTSLTAIERQVVLLAASVENGCGFCVAAHSMIAVKMAGAPDETVEALRAGESPDDPRLQALATFTRAVVTQRGRVPANDLADFFAAGFGARQALEVVLGVAMKTLSNYANHLSGTQTNPELSAFGWMRPASNSRE